MAERTSSEAYSTVKKLRDLFKEFEWAEESLRVANAKDAQVAELEQKIATLGESLAHVQDSLQAKEAEYDGVVRSLQQKRVVAQDHYDAFVKEQDKQKAIYEKNVNQAKARMDQQYKEQYDIKQAQLAALDETIRQKQGQIDRLDRKIGELREDIASIGR